MGMIEGYEYGRQKGMKGHVRELWVMKWGKECGCQADASLECCFKLSARASERAFIISVGVLSGISNITFTNHPPVMVIGHVN